MGSCHHIELPNTTVVGWGAQSGTVANVAVRLASGAWTFMEVGSNSPQLKYAQQAARLSRLRGLGVAASGSIEMTVVG